MYVRHVLLSVLVSAVVGQEPTETALAWVPGEDSLEIESPLAREVIDFGDETENVYVDDDEFQASISNELEDDERRSLGVTYKKPHDSFSKHQTHSKKVTPYSKYIPTKKSFTPVAQWTPVTKKSYTPAYSKKGYNRWLWKKNQYTTGKYQYPTVVYGKKSNAPVYSKYGHNRWLWKKNGYTTGKYQHPTVTYNKKSYTPMYPNNGHNRWLWKKDQHTTAKYQYPTATYNKKSYTVYTGKKGTRWLWKKHGQNGYRYPAATYNKKTYAPVTTKKGYSPVYSGKSLTRWLMGLKNKHHNWYQIQPTAYKKTYTLPTNSWGKN